MGATALTDRSNRKEKACKKEESIYEIGTFCCYADAEKVVFKRTYCAKVM
jgi:hypothetical protein